MSESASDRAAAPLLHRPVTVHAWEDIVFAHWRHDPASLERLVPRGTRPDVVDGSAWAGLSAYVFRDTRVPPFPPSGRLGSMSGRTCPNADAESRACGSPCSSFSRRSTVTARAAERSQSVA